MAAVAGLRGTGDFATDERPKDFREYILWRNPNGGTPITALMSKVGKESTKDPEFFWWDEPVDIARFAVEGALVAGDTLVTIDSADPDASNPARVWGVARHLKPGDILLVEPASSAAETQTFTYEYLEVLQVVSDTQFTVKRGACGSTPGAIADEGFLLLVGSAYAQGTAEAASASRNPIRYDNNVQIFKTVYEVTKTAAVTKLRTGDVLKNDRKRKSFDHARALEFTTLFGRKSVGTGANGKPLYTTDGIRRFIPAQNTTIFSTAGISFSSTTNNFFDAVYKVFDFESPSGDERIAICGNLALNGLNKAASGTIPGLNINMDEVIQMYGMNLRKLVLPQGTLYVRTHPLLNRHPLFAASMWILDFSAIKWRYMQGRDTDFEDNIQAKGEDVIRGQWLTEGGLEVRYGGLTCGYLGNVIHSTT